MTTMTDTGSLPTVQEAATALCTAISAMVGVEGAMIMLLPTGGDLVIVSSGEAVGSGFDVGSHVPLDRLEQLVAATAEAPWMLDLADPASATLIGAPLVAGLRSLGLTATAYAVIPIEGEIAGVLSIASMAPDGATRIAARLGSLGPLGVLAGTVLGRQATVFRQDEVTRTVIREVIDRQLFSVVFQPIVRLADREVVGVEALTRFHDGTSTEERFRAAESVGLRVELEEACARAVCVQEERLPAGAFLSVNFSPRAVTSGSIERAMADVRHPLVVELTENAVVADYPALRTALDRGPRRFLAIDDAGSGYASLRHILELRPDYVKLDVGIVHHVDRDPARSAMVAGMCHFARLTGTTLIAEGVETEEEAAMLRELDVPLAQGYLFGRPTALV